MLSGALRIAISETTREVKKIRVEDCTVQGGLDFVMSVKRQNNLINGSILSNSY